MNCTDAIILNDTREIFLINTSKNIMSYGDFYCIIPSKVKLDNCFLFILNFSK